MIDAPRYATVYWDGLNWRLHLEQARIGAGDGVDAPLYGPQGRRFGLGATDAQLLTAARLQGAAGRVIEIQAEHLSRTVAYRPGVTPL